MSLHPELVEGLNAKCNMSRPQAGFTLLEILVVILLISILMSIGAVYLIGFTKGLTLESEASRIASYLQVTRDLAIDSGNTATLRFVKQGEVTVMKYTGRMVTDCFRMEDNTGTFGTTFSAGSASFENGLVGRCLYFEDGESADLGDNPRWQLNEGFFIELWLKIEAISAETELIKRPGQFTLSLVPGTGPLVRLKGTVTLADATEESFEDTAVGLETGRWVKIGLACCSGKAALFQNDILAADHDLSGTLAAAGTGNMTILDGQTGFAGRVDELTVSKWGHLGEKSLTVNLKIGQLEIRLADGDATNDFYDISFGADGRPVNGSSAVVTVEYKNKSKNVMIGHSGIIYK